MNRLKLLLIPALLLTLSAAQAQDAPNCALANAVDPETYDLINMTQWSEADQDASSAAWADCRAAKLRKDLAGNPQLKARMDTLRDNYRQLRALEGEFAYIRNGGGTMYSHAIPRMYPYLETQLGSLAALARTPQGGQTAPRFTDIIEQGKTQHADYIKALRAYKPDSGAAYSNYKPQDWTKAVSKYEATGKKIMQILGNRGDAATALGYSILNAVTFPASDE